MLHDVGTIKPGSGHRLGGPLTGIDTPTLRGLASSARYLHDGSAPDLSSVFEPTNAPPGSPHAAFQTLAPTEQTELLAFLTELDGAETAAPPASPRLDFSPSGNSLMLQWPTAASAFALFSATNLSPPVIWTAVTNSPQTNGTALILPLPLTDAQRFFLLRSQ